MYETIKKFCENDLTNGLFLMDLPTGFGKTHNVIQYIFDAVCDEKNKDKKFFFVTNLKKNLPEKQLRDLFERNGRKEEFEQKFLFLNSNAELAIEGYNKNPNIMLKVPPEIQKLDETKFFFQSLKDISRQRKLKKDGFGDFGVNAETIFATKIERDFRHKMEKLLKNEFGKVDERREAVQKNGKWGWLGELYESTKTAEKQIIILSAKKFVTKNDTLVEPPYLFYTSKMMENAVVFIDEFDAVKKDFLDNIIDDGIREQVDFIKLFKRIHDSLMETNFPNDIFRESNWYKGKKYGKKPIRSVLDGFKKNASEILNKYNLSSLIRTKKGQDKDLLKNFLFQDNLYHTITNDNKYISVVYNDEEARNEIFISDEKKKNEAISIQALLSKVRGFISFFQIGVKRLAYNVYFYRRENKIDDGEFTFEAAVSSILNPFGLDKDQLWFLKNQILQDIKPKNSLGVSKDFDLNFCSKGLRYYTFSNDVFDDFQSAINVFAFNNTPEKILLNTCERAKVVGISATASIPSVVGNFDLKYLNEQLGELYQVMSESDRSRLRKRFEEEQSGYDRHNIKINVELLGEEILKCNDESVWVNIYGDAETAKEAFGIVSDASSNSFDSKNAKYNIERYYRITQAYKKFYEHEEDVQSFLCMLTANPKEAKGYFRRDVLLNLFKLLDNDAEKKVRWLTTENFEDDKKAITDELEAGNRIFLVSAYATLGAGQNLQYGVPIKKQKCLPMINESRKGDEKDFDAIYLDNPTNLLVNKAVDNMPQEDLVRFLFQAEYLKAAGEISPELTMQHVKKAFEVFGSQRRPVIQPPTILDRESVKLYATKSLIQAVGRICRTNRKSKNIYIYADSRISDNLDCRVAKKLILNREFEKLVEAVDSQRELKMVKGSLECQAEEKSVTVNSFIHAVMEGEWSDADVERWKSLREFALQHPTISREELNKCKMHSFYAEMGRKSNILYFGQEADYRRVHISFAHGVENCPCIESAESSRLDKFMSRPMLRQYFKEQGYATSFEPNDFMMVPTMWNNIYKGALGEVVGKFLFSRMFGMELEEITDLSAFELFDFKVPGKPYYVDFKHWSPGTDVQREKMIDKIFEKAVKCGAEKVLVVNILADKRYPCHDYEGGLEILAVPSLLYDDGTMHSNTEAVERITRFIG